MRWEELTGEAFEAAVEACRGVCILPIGVLEYHGPHLPLGTDTIRAHRMACDVAAVEPAIVFPVLPFTANTECKIYPGGVVTHDRLLFDLLENICDEIARNGLHKIILLTGHGGNKWFLPLFVQLMLDKNKAFIPYFLNNRGVDPEAVGGYMDFGVFRATFETEAYGHADEWETSEILHLQPELVHLERVGDQSWLPEDRLAHLPHTYTPVDWFSRQPDLTRGTPGPSTAEKGRMFWEHQVERLVAIVKAIKEDTRAEELYREFNNRIYCR
ncbi:MAG: creatininase family protein [Ardenticatenaceae bacterium]|nr:creatininase family protein [Ardenticatenaceae bacterium]